MTNNKLICPKCGCEVIEDDCLDWEFYHDSYIRECVGHCEQCNTEYQWSQVFDVTLNGNRNFRKC